MKNRYQKAISKIQTTEEFRQNLIEQMKQEQKNAKVGISLKLRNLFATIAGILSLAVCSGLVYATITGSWKFGSQEIEFSENIQEYIEQVDNQILEKDGNKVELISKVSDDGFVILGFDIQLSDEEVQKVKENRGRGFQYLSFNDPDIIEISSNA